MIPPLSRNSFRTSRVCAPSPTKSTLLPRWQTAANGGNCEECEWVDVYSWDGVLLGSEGGKRKKVTAIGAAVKAAYDKQASPIGKTELPGFYSAAPQYGRIGARRRKGRVHRAPVVAGLIVR